MRQRLRQTNQRTLGIAALFIVVVAVLNLVPLVLDGGGLGHDESAYALKARHWIDGTPETGWNLHRGIAVSAYGWLVFELGGAEAALRAWGILALLGLAGATWSLGSTMSHKLVGPLSAIAVVSSPALLRRSTEYLSDVPAAALLVACMIVLWRELALRDEPSYRLLWLVPLGSAAFYIRYQSALALALMAITIGVLFGEKLRRGWRPVAAATALGLLSLLPHFLFSISETGSPLGILTFTADVAGRDFFGQGLADYVLLMGWPLAGLIGPFLAIFFLWWLARGWESPAQRRMCLFLLIPTVGQVLALGILSHGEARFIFFPLALTIVGGIIGFLHVSERWKEGTRSMVTVALLVLIAGSTVASAINVHRAVSGRILETRTVVEASEVIVDLSGGGSCGVMTSYQPQVTFYSECVTAPFRTNLDPIDALARFGGDAKFLLLVEDGKRQPSGDDLAFLVDVTQGAPVEVGGGDDTAVVYRFAEG